METNDAHDFKYVARDGDLVLDDPDLYITINVSIRWFDGVTMRKPFTKSIDVYNQKVNPGTKYTTLDFELDSLAGFNEEVVVGKFECDAIDSSINSDGKDVLTGYDYTLLTGKTTARHYYQVINSKTYGGYGVLNQEKLAEENPGMSYLEIAFEVEKSINDFSTNYDFYVGFSQLYYAQQNLDWVK